MTEKDYDFCVENFSDGVYRFILKHAHDEMLSKDIVQDTFMRLWEKRNMVDSTKAKSYIFSTAYHALIDEIRRHSLTITKYEVKTSTQSHYSDAKDILNQALECLPKIQKSVLLLRDYEGYSYAEIGDIMKLTEQQVKVYIFRARVTLKNYIGNINNIV